MTIVPYGSIWKCENQVLENPCDIANIFNSYFSTIGENLANNIPPTTKHFSKFLDKSITNSIFFAPTTKYEITDIVTAMKNKQSAGHDDISNFILKGAISSIADPLEHIKWCIPWANENCQGYPFIQ